MERSDRRQRILLTLSQMVTEDLDALLISCPENRFYLSGFYAEDIAINESAGMLFITKEFQAVITDFRYTESAMLEAPDFKILQYSHHNPKEKVISELCSEYKVRRLGIEAEFLSVSNYLAIEEALGKEKLPTSLVPTKGFLEKIRAIKDVTELSLIRESLRLSEKVMEEVYDFVKPGVTEREVAWFIEKRIKELGAQSVAFPPIVAGGSRSALPHAHPTDRELKEGEPIIIDMGARLNHYCSDITRTIFLRHIPERWERIYDIVARAQMLAINAIKVGITGEELDRTARDLIEQEGYGECFGHGLGHGVGLAIHEFPGIRKTSNITIGPGMVFTVEPGIYIPGEGGIRLENMVLMTEEGMEILNRLPPYPPIVIK
ncbi:MAG: Xaa-Pro peptidase family protein [Syntrophobacterales bacterium]|nr:Xaa-Pro peptidase family protein [Syntrophobacterales bacterium]